MKYSHQQYWINEKSLIGVKSSNHIKMAAPKSIFTDMWDSPSVFFINDNQKLGCIKSKTYASLLITGFNIISSIIIPPNIDIPMNKLVILK
jgi:hypothetical protein